MSLGSGGSALNAMERIICILERGTLITKFYSRKKPESKFLILRRETRQVGSICISPRPQSWLIWLHTFIITTHKANIFFLSFFRDCSLIWLQFFLCARFLPSTFISHSSLIIIIKYIHFCVCCFFFFGFSSCGGMYRAIRVQIVQIMMAAYSWAK